ncbi:MAG: hypothetical protein ACI4OR_00120 [Alphaproteobacteria bacterium]
MAFKDLGSFLVFRISLVASLLLLTTLVLLTLTAVQVGGDLKVLVQFFPTTKDSATLREFSQLNTLSPIEKGDRKLIEEMLVRHYLDMRYEQIPDVREMKYRWGIPGPVYILSNLPVYNEFAADLEKKLENLPDTITTIEIEEIKAQDNRFQVNFRILENMPGGQVRVREKNAVLEFRYATGRPRWDPKLINPYGLIFVRFEERDRKRATE